MTGELPNALTVCGKQLPIRADFRNVLRIFEAIEDPRLTEREKVYILLMRLFETPPESDADEALKQAVWFLDGGDMPKTKPEARPVLDWKHDENMLIPAVSRAAGVPDVRALPFLHWWTFLGLFGEIGEGLFSTVLSIRTKQARGKKLMDAEREFLSRNRELIALRTAEEKAAIDETEAFLNTIT